ncbi:fatty acid--CoA ligase [Rhizobium halophytocola]|uniref:Long-chain acyl-CoA synthetase n=1 Tax=Rhizobium halophytocola TaxID=735519 RepID=A0ABS4DZX4_9HYPH|nr:fatty acid--CoA ligase [Rhizobium halophytocola]MBP1851235.1 long-chain acyl-CoA synthetase [Rhizobium halophytocola]
MPVSSPSPTSPKSGVIEASAPFPADSAIQTLGDVVRYHGKHRPEALATWQEGRSTSYRELDARASRIAQALIAHGLGKGDRVVFVGKNSDSYYELLFGCAKAGVVLVPASWRLAVAELSYILNDCRAPIVFTDRFCADTVVQIGAIAQTVIAMDRAMDGWLTFADWRDAHPADDPKTTLVPDDIGLQLYTSGTAGRPKGAQISHANLNWACLGPHSLGEAWAQWADGDVSLVALPMSHISGTGWGYMGYYFGVLNVILSEFEPSAALAAIARHRVTKLLVVPAALRFMLAHPDVETTDFSSLRHLVYGASPIPLDLLRQAIKIVGCDFCQLYGLTETTGPIVTLPPEDHDPAGTPRMRSAGRPYPNVELRIRKAGGALATTREIGEIETRSPYNVRGYWNLPEATAAAWTTDGWLKTGDAGYIDEDGYVFIQDRISEMIVSGGENIYPAEVESAIFGHPDVADVAVIGVPDRKWGEAVKALVVLNPGRQIDAASIIAFARQNLAAFKAPKSVDFIDSLPRNPSGKIMRRVLRAPYWEGRDRQIN